MPIAFSELASAAAARKKRNQKKETRATTPLETSSIIADNVDSSPPILHRGLVNDPQQSEEEVINQFIKNLEGTAAAPTEEGQKGGSDTSVTKGSPKLLLWKDDDENASTSVDPSTNIVQSPLHPCDNSEQHCDVHLPITSDVELQPREAEKKKRANSAGQNEIASVSEEQAKTRLQNDLEVMSTQWGGHDNATPALPIESETEGATDLSKSMLLPSHDAERCKKALDSPLSQGSSDKYASAALKPTENVAKMKSNNEEAGDSTEVSNPINTHVWEKDNTTERNEGVIPDKQDESTCKNEQSDMPSHYEEHNRAEQSKLSESETKINNVDSKPIVIPPLIDEEEDCSTIGGEHVSGVSSDEVANTVKPIAQIHAQTMESFDNEMSKGAAETSDKVIENEQWESSLLHDGTKHRVIITSSSNDGTESHDQHDTEQEERIDENAETPRKQNRRPVLKISPNDDDDEDEPQQSLAQMPSMLNAVKKDPNNRVCSRPAAQCMPNEQQQSTTTFGYVLPAEGNYFSKDQELREGGELSAISPASSFSSLFRKRSLSARNLSDTASRFSPGADAIPSPPPSPSHLARPSSRSNLFSPNGILGFSNPSKASPPLSESRGGRNLRRWARKVALNTASSVAAGATAVAANMREDQGENGDGVVKSSPSFDSLHDADSKSITSEANQNQQRLRNIKYALAGRLESVGTGASNLKGRLERKVCEEKENDKITVPEMAVISANLLVVQANELPDRLRMQSTEILSSAKILNKTKEQDDAYVGRRSATSAYATTEGFATPVTAKAELLPPDTESLFADDLSDHESVGTISSTSSITSSPFPSMMNLARPQQFVAAIGARLTDRLQPCNETLVTPKLQTSDTFESLADEGTGSRSGSTYVSGGAASVGRGTRKNHSTIRRRKIKSLSNSRTPSRRGSITSPQQESRNRPSLISEELNPFLEYAGGSVPARTVLVPSDSFRVMGEAGVDDDVGALWLEADDVSISQKKNDSRSDCEPITSTAVNANSGKKVKVDGNNGKADQQDYTNEMHVFPSPTEQISEVPSLLKEVATTKEDDKQGILVRAVIDEELNIDSNSLEIVSPKIEENGANKNSINGASQTHDVVTDLTNFTGMPSKTKKAADGLSNFTHGDVFCPTSNCDLLNNAEDGSADLGSLIFATDSLDSGQRALLKDDSSSAISVASIPRPSECQQASKTVVTRKGNSDNDSTESTTSRSEEYLNFALMKLTSPLDLDKVSTVIDDEREGKNLVIHPEASVRWHHMIALWQHQMMTSVILTRSTSHHFAEDDEEEALSISDIPDNQLEDCTRTESSKSWFASKTENTSGFPPSLPPESDQRSISTYIAELGPLPVCCRLQRKHFRACNKFQKSLKDRGAESRSGQVCSHRWEGFSKHNSGNSVLHQVCHLVETDSQYNGARDPLQHDSSVLCDIYKKKYSNHVLKLVQAAEESMPFFKKVIHRIASFAAQNSTSSRLRQMSPRPSCEVGIKESESITEKAKQKYNGDVRLVKDILRGSLTLPDDAGIVCALIALERICDEAGQEECDGSVKIVRIKNLFRTSQLGKAVPSDLPTGYRHVLVNVRLQCGLLAGYSLHKEIGRLASSRQPRCRADCMCNCPFKWSVDHVQNTSELVLCKCAESPRDVSTYLKSIMNSLDESESSLLLESLIYVGRCDLSGDDKTVDRYICLHELLKARYMLHRSESDFRASVAVLERTIEICDQASAVGMTGWMEFGSPSSLERLNLLPLEQLSRLASFYGQIGCWDKVAETTMSLLLRSERSLPLYHPRTVVALLDHTAALLRTKISRNVRQAGKFLDRSNERISLFLTEHIKRHRSQELNADAPRVDGASRSSMNWVRGFTAALKELGVRPFASILGTCDPSVLLYNSYLGDALSVLAKYGGQPPPIKLSFSESLWKLAAQFYRVALRGWLHIGGRRHANVPLTACGLARCLWEVNQRSECIDILSFAIGSSRGSVPLRSLESSELVSNRAGASSTEPPSDAELKCTLLISCQVNQLVSRMKLAYEESLAVCLWWMAAYFVEASANDRSRLRALSLLHAATEALQIGLKNQCAGSQKAREKCSKFVEVVEKEAKELFST